MLKSFAKFVALIIATFAVSCIFVTIKVRSHKKQDITLHAKRHKLLEFLSSNVNLATPGVVKEHKPFVVVIPSYNNEKFLEKNLSSVLNQKYPNFRVIYINDSSTDNTKNLVENFVENHPMHEKVRIIHNKTNQGALANFYKAINSCQDYEIIVTVDGDDWLCHDEVLKKLNEYYANDEIWLTWGSYLTYPDYKQGVSRGINKVLLKEGRVREIPWFFSQLRTFYAALFKKIKYEDLVYKGNMFQTCSDLAFMYPMLEMANTHAYYTPDIFYLYNRQSCINDDKVRSRMQKKTDKIIKQRTRYKPLKSILKNQLI